MGRSEKFGDETILRRVALTGDGHETGNAVRDRPRLIGMDEMTRAAELLRELTTMAQIGHRLGLYSSRLTCRQHDKTEDHPTKLLGHVAR